MNETLSLGISLVVARTAYVQDIRELFFDAGAGVGEGRAGVAVAIVNLRDDVVVRTGFDRLTEGSVGVDALGGQHDARDDVAGGRGRVNPAHDLAFQVLQRLDAAVGADDDLAGVGRGVKARRDQAGVDAALLIGHHIVERV